MIIIKEHAYTHWVVLITKDITSPPEQIGQVVTRTSYQLILRNPFNLGHK